MRVPEVSFLGEQDGDSERSLKAQLREIFKEEQQVVSAYLTRVDYAGSTVSVALCLRIQGDGHEDRLVNQVGKTFASMFGQHEHLDIIFLSDTQESELAHVCPAFFSRL